VSTLIQTPSPGIGVAAQAPVLIQTGCPHRNDGRWLRVLSVEEGYHLWADTYDSDLNPLLTLEERVLAPLLPDVRTKTVVDLACGTGRWLKRLLDRGARLAIGVDLSWAMLGRAASKGQLRRHVIRADCLRLPVRTETADLVICSLSIGHISELGGFAGEIARIGKHECDVYITDLHPEAYAYGWRSGFRHSTGSREIRTYQHSKENIVNAFQKWAFEPLPFMEPHFDWPERGIFAAAGKADEFEQLRRIPALLVYHFARR
jgi:malonyl-CoA O-methyltransferase